MKNNTFYFSHDFNAHNDVKILFLRQQLGMEGYGIYWFLIESLADAGGVLPLKIIPVLSMQMQTNEVKVSAVINEFDLFNVVDDKFFSVRLNEHLSKVNNIKSINSQKGKRSAEVRRLNSVEHRLNNGSTAAEQRKGKERKEKEIIKGISFSDDKLRVNFPDGTSQILGESQLSLVKANMTNPSQMIKGYIY
jgi:hypothetical protein